MLGDSLRRRHGATAREPADQEKPERPEQRARRPRPKRGGRRRFTFWHWLAAAVVMLAGSFGVGYLLSTLVLFPRPETAGAGASVPSLYGELRAQAEEAIRSAGLEVGEVTGVASMDTERGRVLAQSPVPGQQLFPGGAVSFSVSAGPPELTVPPLAGMSEPTAREFLEAAGFGVQVRYVEVADEPPGMVLRTEPIAGVARTLPAVVTLMVGAAPPEEPRDRGVAPIGTAVPANASTTSGGGPQ